MRSLIDALAKWLLCRLHLGRSLPRGRRSGRLDQDCLADLFRKLGCSDPECWARSQVEEGINQLGRFLFIRRCWTEIAAGGDPGWVDTVLSNTPAETPPGRALRKILATGVKRSDLAAVVRSVQIELLFSICHIIDDPEDGEDLEVASFRWALFEVDEVGRPVAPIPFLHESVLELDPARRSDPA